MAWQLTDCWQVFASNMSLAATDGFVSRLANKKAVELGLEGTTERSGNASAMHCISSQASQSLAVKSL